MRYRINEIKLEIGQDKGMLPVKIEKKLGLKPGEVRDWELRRESIDSRDKKNIRLVYTVDFSCNKRIKSKLVSEVDEAPADEIMPGGEELAGRPVVVGFGPCGIFAALELAKRGYRPIVIERGAAMNQRVSDVEAFRNGGVLKTESNMLFGEGGAGTFSDGKLTTGIKNGKIRDVLGIFRDAGAGDDIMYLHRPHIGTDVLRSVIVNLREEIIRLGGEVRFGCKLEELVLEGDVLKGIVVSERMDGNSANCGGVCGLVDAESTGSHREQLPCNALILAIGHSARDSFAMINESGLNMEQKPFSIGVRIEHPQELIDRAQYGDEKRLPPADYKLAYHASNDRGVYSFCMCPGGEVVVCSTAEGELCVNGMSNRKRDSGVANSGILCDVRTEDFGSDDVLAGVRFQQKYERLAFENGGRTYKAPSCKMKDFLEEGSEAAIPVVDSMPEFASTAIREAIPNFARKIKGYDMPDARITAVETRSSSPVRILRGSDGESNIKGIYPAGEGAGYAGGITSAACDGIKAAENIIKKFKPC